MILFLSISNIIANALTIVSGLFVAKWLLPEELGSFSSFTIITGYIILIQLGIPSGLSRELPYFLGKGSKEEAYAYASAAQFWQKGLGLVVLTLGAVVSMFCLIRGEYMIAAGSLVIGFTAWQGLYVTKYLKVLYRTNRDFNKLSWIKLVVAATSFISIVFVYKFNFYGLCMRAILVVLIDFAVTYAWRPIKVKARFEKAPFMALMRVGLPMYGVANIYGLWPLLQRTIVVSLGGPKALGLFALATMVEGAMKTVSSSISSVIYPTMAAQWGTGATVKLLVKSARRPIIMASGIFFISIPFAWWILPIFVESVLPNYMEGVNAAQWMLLVGFLGLFTVFGNIYNVIKNQKDRLKMFILGISGWAVTVVVIYYIQGYSLVIFPKAMVVAYLIMLAVNAFHIKRDLELNAEDK